MSTESSTECLLGAPPRSNWNLDALVFSGEGKTGVPGEKPLGARTRTNNKLNPHMTPGPGVEPGPHWWEAIVLNTAPSLLPALRSLWLHTTPGAEAQCRNTKKKKPLFRHYATLYFYLGIV